MWTLTAQTLKTRAWALGLFLVLILNSLQPVHAEIYGDPPFDLESPAGSEARQFGDDIVIDGEVLVVSDAQEVVQLSEDYSVSGVIYIYYRKDSGWELHQRIPAPLIGCSVFGYRVALKDGVLVVGSKYYTPYLGNHQFGVTTGAVFVYEVEGDAVWTLKQIIAPEGLEAYGGFGSDVAIESDTLVVSAGYDSHGGSAYVFSRNNDAWELEAHLVPAGEGNSGNWRDNVSLDRREQDTTVVLSAEYNGSPPVVFRRTGDTWADEGPLVFPEAPEFSIGVYYNSAAVSDGVIAATRQIDGGGYPYSWPELFFFQRTNNTWTAYQSHSFRNDSSFWYPQSISISMDDGMAVFGNRNASYVTGAVCVFEKNNQTWTQKQKLKPIYSTYPQMGPGIGLAVSLSGGVLAASANPGRNFAGGATIYELSRRNDEVYMPLILEGDSGSIEVDLVGATQGDGEISPSVWYQWHPKEDGYFRFGSEGVASAHAVDVFSDYLSDGNLQSQGSYSYNEGESGGTNARYAQFYAFANNNYVFRVSSPFSNVLRWRFEKTEKIMNVVAKSVVQAGIDPMTVSWETFSYDAPQVKVQLWKGNTRVSFLTGSIPNHDWWSSDPGKFPLTLPQGSDYRFFVYTPDYRLSAFSNYFTVNNILALSTPSPSGSTVWSAGQTVQITWTSSPAVGPTVKLRLYRGNTPIMFLSGNLPNNGAYSWKVPDTLVAANDYRILLYKPDYSISNWSANFKIDNPLLLTAPTGGESWAAGSSVNVTWQSDAQLVGANVKLRLYKAGAPLMFLTGNISNSGTYTWRIPTTLLPGNDYKLQLYTPTYSYSRTSNAFSITLPALNLTSPTGSTSWKKGTTQQITWTSNVGLVGNTVKLRLYRFGSPVAFLTGNIANSGSYSWSIPGSLAAGTGYTIQLYKPDYTFQVLSPVFSIVN